MLNDEIEVISKTVFVLFIELLSWNLLGGTKQKKQNLSITGVLAWIRKVYLLNSRLARSSETRLLVAGY
jgi:hypothetical protein